VITSRSDLFKTTGRGDRSVQDMAPTFNAIGLAVADMATTLAFYRTLGLDIPNEMDKEQHAEAALAGDVRLMFDTHELITSFDPGHRPPPGGGTSSLAFLCADAADVDRVHAAMVAAGHPSRLDPFDAPWGQRYATLDDPDGNGVDLFAPLTSPA
jgi:catechol 2,3-dioxygenase-like lactoylglutathione lyase family enzyme